MKDYIPTQPLPTIPSIMDWLLRTAVESSIFLQVHQGMFHDWTSVTIREYFNSASSFYDITIGLTTQLAKRKCMQD
jgi:hypothetical protein